MWELKKNVAFRLIRPRGPQLANRHTPMGRAQLRGTTTTKTIKSTRPWPPGRPYATTACSPLPAPHSLQDFNGASSRARATLLQRFRGGTAFSTLDLRRKNKGNVAQKLCHSCSLKVRDEIDVLLLYFCQTSALTPFPRRRPQYYYRRGARSIYFLSI